MARHFTILAAVSIIFLTLVTSAHAAGDAAAGDAGEKAARAWLKLIDDANYSQSWSEASSLFRGAVPRDRWTQQVAAVRGPLGAVESRKLNSEKNLTSLPGAPDGLYVVIEYNTTFAHKKSAVETLALQTDTDGHWRVSGYFIR